MLVARSATVAEVRHLQVVLSSNSNSNGILVLILIITVIKPIIMV